ncbi:putative tyrosine-protein kinase Wsck [Venturia canescens]|uniref:putative tyrosine-protein kinase Wsck n=1 Tax=Venturia canescens TaxID=32260 RepID=UPI001C9C9D93|nr:putative tyrosine-protein kinase Wsck [Venturia canescens]
MKCAAFFWAFLAFAVTFSRTQDYLGCFKSTNNESDFLTLVQAWPSSPNQCAAECRRRYFMYAGLMHGQQCYCGSHYGRNGPSHACTLPCNSDPGNYCGSDESISVYTTGQKGPSPPRRLQVLESKSSSLFVTWEPPDLHNGNLTSYAVTAMVVSTYASYKISPSQTIVQGGSSNSTTLISLHPGSKYNVSITAWNSNGESDPASVLGWTLIGAPEKPEKPKIIEESGKTMTIQLFKGRSENGPVTAYQIIIVERFLIPPKDDKFVYTNYNRAVEESLGYYVTGQFDAVDFPRYEKFVIGDGKPIGGFYNAPLKDRFLDPQIGFVVISRLGRESRSSYSDLATARVYSLGSQNSNANLGLRIAIAILSIALVVSVVGYFVIRKRHLQNRMRKLPEQQELTLQGPIHEVDNMAYIPEDVPERINHYQNLKEKVWSIPKNFLTIDSNVLRRGRFGSVHTGTVQKNGTTSSAVVHCIADNTLRQSEKRNMLRDLDVCIKAGSMKYLASLVGTCETPEILYVVLEMPERTLKNRLLAARSGESFPNDQILKIGASIASALRHLESLKILHTRLCARSVGLSDDFTPKLMGFGIGKYALEDIKYTRWMAVECFTKQKKSPQAVVWAFGVLIWEMLSMGGTPYGHLVNDIDVEEAVDQGLKLPQLVDTPDPLYEVLLSCWQTDQQERPTFDELVRLNTLSLCPITAITEPYVAELEVN